MSDAELEERKHELATQVVGLARQSLLANAYFLASALQKLPLEFRELGTPFATDGRKLFVDADVVLSEYARTRKPPVHDLAHVLFHCLLLHPFVRDAHDLDRGAWELASDIEAERLAAELLGPREGPRGKALEVITSTIKTQVGDSLSTESIYRALKGGAFSRKRATWKKVVGVDDPTWWPSNTRRKSRGRGEASESPDASHAVHEGGGPHTSSASGSYKKPKAGQGSESARGASSRPSKPPEAKDSPRSHGDKNRNNTALPNTRPTQEAYDERAEVGGLDRAEDLRQEWRRAARSVHLDLDTMSSRRGRSLREISHALELSGTPHTSLEDFLRQFGAYHEVMHLSPDEFDYVFYTYGLKLFGNMPLIENLEASEQRRVHDFALVIDTSGSVEGAVVKRFVEEAFGVLSAENLYCDEVNVHVIQCDAQVREDAKLTTKADVQRWKSKVVLRGFGGTDFRPAFAYVDELVAKGELANLVGLLYFTDGWGTYPVRPPAYRVAFVFYDSNHPRGQVPPWAMQLELSRQQLSERGAHEH